MTDSIKHLLGSVSISGIKHLEREEKEEREREREGGRERCVCVCVRSVVGVWIRWGGGGKHYFHSLKHAPPKTAVPLFMTMKREGIFKINHRMSHVY